MNNVDRAVSVDDAIQKFAADMGLDLRPEADGPTTGAGDMFANLMHWVAERAGVEEALRAAQNGISSFLVEFAAYPGEDPDGEADVTFHATGRQIDGAGRMDLFTVDVRKRGEIAIHGLTAGRAAFKVLGNG